MRKLRPGYRNFGTEGETFIRSNELHAKFSKIYSRICLGFWQGMRIIHNSKRISNEILSTI